MDLTVGISDILYKSLTLEEANCLHMCSRVSGEVIGHYALLFNCYRRHQPGRFVYMIRTTSYIGGIYIKEFLVYTDFHQYAAQCK